MPDYRSNQLSVGVNYDVGASDDPEGADGLAHYAEHVMFYAAYRGADGPALNEVDRTNGECVHRFERERTSNRAARVPGAGAADGGECDPAGRKISAVRGDKKAVEAALEVLGEGEDRMDRSDEAG